MFDYPILYLWMAIPSEIIKTEKRLVKKIAKSFISLWNLLSASVRDWEINNNVLIQLHFEKLVPDINSELESLYNRWWRKIKSKLDLQTWVDYIVMQARKYIEFKKSQMLSNSNLSITQTTKEWIANVIAKWLWEWKSYWDIADDIIWQTWAWVLSKARAQLIAVRESWLAYEEARLETLNKHLIDTGDRAEKIWDTVWDDRVTEQCRENEAMWWIMKDEAFKSWDNNAPRNWNPRCRCTTNYRII